MFRTRRSAVKCSHPIVSYFEEVCVGSKNIRNNTNFVIRNVMTGVQKDVSSLTQNEKDVLDKVRRAVPLYNQLKENTYQKKLAAYQEAVRLSKENPDINVPDEPKAPSFMEMPTAEKWMLDYGFIDFLFKIEKDENYYSTPSHVSQHAIKKRTSEWKSYFAALKSYKKNPSSFNGRPNIPGYIRDDKCTATFTNQACRKVVSGGKMFLKFTGYKKLFPFGKDNGLPLVHTEVVPKYNGYEVLATFDDESIPSEEVPVSEDASRFYGIDFGVDNFISVSNNFGETPFIISGGMIKAENQWFNKEKARLTSILTKGRSSTKDVSSRRLRALSEKRERRLRDWFYRIGHFIFRRAEATGVHAIVIGHNDNQKQNISLGQKNNQSFVSIPFSKMVFILRVLSREYEIPVIVREESYTSKASLIDGNEIPTYGDEEKETFVFSGKRIQRGLYRSKDGILINADINAASNIIRKEYPDAFKDVKDFSFLTESIEKLSVQEILYCPCKNSETGNPVTLTKMKTAVRKTAA